MAYGRNRIAKKLSVIVSIVSLIFRDTASLSSKDHREAVEVKAFVTVSTGWELPLSTKKGEPFQGTTKVIQSS